MAITSKSPNDWSRIDRTAGTTYRSWLKTGTMTLTFGILPEAVTLWSIVLDDGKDTRHEATEKGDEKAYRKTLRTRSFT